MPYDRLLKQGLIKRYRASPIEIKQLLSVATRDLNASVRNLSEDPDWAFTMAYNAVLQASRALMLTDSLIEIIAVWVGMDIAFISVRGPMAGVTGKSRT